MRAPIRERERSARWRTKKIIELYWQRSPQAIDETSRKYGAYCMRLSMNILMNREDSEENVNDTYLRVWNAIPPQRPQFFAAFLGRIARNLALNRYKARAAEKRGGGEAALSLEELAECLPSGSEPQDEAEAAAFSPPSQRIFCAPKARRPAGCSCSDISCAAQSRTSPTTLDFPKAVSNPCCCVPAPVWQKYL